MKLSQILVLMAFAAVIGIPLALRPRSAAAPADAATLVVITPHNSQIRSEFARAFNDWHLREHGRPVVIDWRQPGGTSDIRRILTALYTKAVKEGQIAPDGSVTSGSMPYDICFGGGSYEHNKIKQGVKVEVPGREGLVQVAMSVPAPFDQAQLDDWFGENVIGAEKLYDPEKYWLGAALSGFGIVFNRDVLRMLGLPDPDSWEDFAAPELVGWAALADPRQSGSVETTYDSILNVYGWEDGWKILRAMCANSRYFSNSSAKVPVDVAQGEAAIGVAIDFYGRYEAQAVMQPDETPETSRVGYVDPPGAVYIDADPISIMRGGPNPEIAARFVQFVLSEQGQALWQFAAKDSGDGWGPEKYELRRMPVRRVMYENYRDQFVDKEIDPFNAASKTSPQGWRPSIKLIMSACSIDIHHEQVEAWKAMQLVLRDDSYSPSDKEIVEFLFFKMPVHQFPDGTKLYLNEENYKLIAADWERARQAGTYDEIRMAYTAGFRENYARILMIYRRESTMPEIGLPVLTD